MAYLLDANVFIQAKNLHYGFDFCPGFWDWIVQAHEAGKVFSIEKVGDELQGMADELTAWADTRGNGFFLPPDPVVLPALGTVSAWVSGEPRYDAAAKSTFLQIADYWLVAHALSHRHTVVTNEKPAPHAKKRIKIPDVCVALGVKCMTPFEMLRTERARFVLGA